MQIRVRAWHRKQKKMYYPEEMGADQLTLMSDGQGFINVHGRDTQLSKIYGDTMVPLMSTGLRDKNGKEIYLGDVIRDNTGLCVVAWNEKLASICLRRNGWAFDHFFEEAVSPKDCEIVGNLYENPNLIGGEPMR